MNDIKLIILGEELELQGDLGFSLNYNIDNIKNPTNRNGNYSKTVTILGTKKANKIFGGIFDINADFTYFNPKLKSEVKILVNSVEVINGFMQIKSINKEHKGRVSGSYVAYNVSIQSNSTDFFTDIKDKKLSELDFSDFNHNLTRTTVSSSWGNESSECYVYPLFLNNFGNTYGMTSFKPAIFHKAYLRRIIGEAGYSAGGSLLDETTAEGAAYSKDIIPFNGGEVLVNSLVAEDSLFQAGQASDDIILNSQVANDGQTFNLTFPLINDVNPPNFNNGDYDPATGFNPTGSGSYNFRVKQDLEVVYSSTDSQPFKIGGIAIYSVFITINGVRERVLFSEEILLPTLSSAGDSVTLNFSFDTTSAPVYLLDGQDCYLDIQIQFKKGALLLFPFNGTNLKFTVKNSLYSNQRNRTSVNDGDLIVLNEYIPKKIKQSDIITDLIKRYNAYIYVDPDDSKKIIFDTRDTFYNTGNTLDWTSKKDYSKKDKISLLSDLQNKELNFTYTKENDDFFNDKYFNSIGTVFGSKEVDFKTEFGKGTREVKTPFAATPLVGNSFDPVAIVSAIDSSDPATTIRVLHYGGIKNCLPGRTWTLAASDANITYSTYPYAGHLDDPINPTIDINFGQNEIPFYNEALSKTDANLFNRFWKNYVNQINEGKILTTYFNLNEIDIFSVKNKLNTKIFVKDAYYYINKIFDYNPVSKNVTKVELLKINDGVNFLPVVNTSKPVKTDNEIKLTNDKFFGGGGGFSDTIKTNNNINNIKSKDVLVKGNGNTVGKNSDFAVVVGNNNFIGDNVQGAFLIGADDKIIVEDNIGYVGGLRFKDNKVVDGQIGELIISNGVVVSSFGLNNTASGLYATIGGGKDNTASADYSTVGGGLNNAALVVRATVAGGVNNTASGNNSTVGGGQINTASLSNSTVGGGRFNGASGNGSTIGGGEENAASGDNSTISGGFGNDAAASNSSISGGLNNSVVHSNAHISGSNITTTQTNCHYVEDQIIDGLNSVTSLATNATGRIVAGASDERLKTNIEPLNSALEKVAMLNGVSYEWTEESGMGADRTKFGFIAQQVQEVIPQMVSISPKTEDTLALDYKEIIPFLVESIKELKNQIEELKSI